MDGELCSRCQNFDIQAFNRSGFGYCGYPLVAVVRAALGEKSCSFCSMLLDHMVVLSRRSENHPLSIALRKETGEPSRIKWTPNQLVYRCFRALVYGVDWVHFRVTKAERLPNRGIEALNIVKVYVHISMGAPPAIFSSFGFNVAADPGTPASASGDITGELFSRDNPWSWSYLDNIKRWHDNCRRDHPDCRKTLSKREQFDVENVRLPKRCLEIQSVGPQNGDGSHSMLLVLRETEGQTGKYIALSHRWDDSTRMARTLRINYKCRTHKCGHGSFDDCTSPPVGPLFSQASLIAFNLGVRYIWIDSVCIIQDDTRDWEQESTKMADYYQFSWLTIATTAPVNEGNWLFANRLETRDLPRVTRLPYRDKDGQQKGHFYLQGTGGSGLSMEYYDNISKSTMLRRGWVYQEWLLSRRVLALTRSSSGLFMLCQSAAPETATGDQVVRLWEETPDEHKAFADKAFKASLGTNLSELRDIVRSWRDIIMSYSGLEITLLEKDRLLALAGVAKEFGAALGARLEEKLAASGDADVEDNNNDDRRGQYCYASGHWFPQIGGLLWEQAQSGPRLRVKGIPTWSWASMASRIVNDQGEETVCGMRVQWGGYKKRGDPRKPLCSVGKVVFISVEPTTWEPRFHRAADPTPDNRYGNDSRFALVSVYGCLKPVRVYEHFASTQDAKLASELTNHGLDFGRDMWRRVATEESPEVVAGWAAIEHPDYQMNEAFRGEVPIYALFVGRIPYSRGGYGFGNWSQSHATFMVLFLKSVEVHGYDRCYERLGVGRLFGKEVEATIKTTQEGAIWLV